MKVEWVMPNRGVGLGPARVGQEGWGGAAGGGRHGWGVGGWGAARGQVWAVAGSWKGGGWLGYGGGKGMSNCPTKPKKVNAGKATNRQAGRKEVTCPSRSNVQQCCGR